MALLSSLYGVGQCIGRVGVEHRMLFRVGYRRSWSRIRSVVPALCTYCRLCILCPLSSDPPCAVASSGCSDIIGHTRMYCSCSVHAVDNPASLYHPSAGNRVGIGRPQSPQTYPQVAHRGLRPISLSNSALFYHSGGSLLSISLFL